MHWRSTARYGELMVRREEQHWRNTASLFIDTRRLAHPTAASFELAVTVAASIGVHMAGEGFDAQLVTDTGTIPCKGEFQDAMLDALAVIRPSREVSLHGGIGALRTGGGQVIAVLGRLTPEQAREIAATRSGAAPRWRWCLPPAPPRGPATGPLPTVTGSRQSPRKSLSAPVASRAGDRRHTACGGLARTAQA